MSHNSSSEVLYKDKNENMEDRKKIWGVEREKFLLEAQNNNEAHYILGFIFVILSIFLLRSTILPKYSYMLLK
jgi:hypothetical protein